MSHKRCHLCNNILLTEPVIKDGYNWCQNCINHPDPYLMREYLKKQKAIKIKRSYKNIQERHFVKPHLTRNQMRILEKDGQLDHVRMKTDVNEVITELFKTVFDAKTIPFELFPQLERKLHVKGFNTVEGVLRMLDKVADIKHYTMQIPDSAFIPRDLKDSKMLRILPTLNIPRYKEIYMLDLDFEKVELVPIPKVAQYTKYQLHAENKEMAKHVYSATKTKWDTYLKRIGFPKIKNVEQWWFYRMIKDQFFVNAINRRNLRHLQNLAKTDNLLLQEAVQACNMLYTLLTGIAEVSPEANKLLQTVEAKRSIDFAETCLEMYWKNPLTPMKYEDIVHGYFGDLTVAKIKNTFGIYGPQYHNMDSSGDTIRKELPFFYRKLCQQAVLNNRIQPIEEKSEPVIIEPYHFQKARIKKVKIKTPSV